MSFVLKAGRQLPPKKPTKFDADWKFSAVHRLAAPPTKPGSGETERDEHKPGHGLYL